MKPRSLWLGAVLVFTILLSLTVQGQQQQSVSKLGTAQLAAGDDVVVMVFQEEELSARVYVDSRNQIALPRIGTLTVTGFTTEMLRDTIRARYASFLREPSIDVHALRRITVNGSVLKPDVYYVDPALTLRDVVALAGGVTPDGNSRRVSIVRGSEQARYPKWRETEQGLTELRSGDQVVVAQRNWIALNAGPLLGAAGVLTTLAIAFLR